MMVTENLELISVNKLQPHPDNPRIAIRQDVVDGIVSQIKESGRFSEMHALIVRPVGDAYQILSGHHRHEAAKKTKTKEVPCWVAELDDDAAFMVLASSNTQGELSTLEIGIHALRAVDRGSPGRGKRGGIQEYADSIGQKRQNISEYRSAAEVYLSIKTASQDAVFHDKAKHLSQIHKTDSSLWPMLAEFLIEKHWSVDDTSHWVKKIKEFDIPDRCDFFLPIMNVVRWFLETKEFSPKTVGKLASIYDATIGIIESFAAEPNHWISEYHEWLESNSGSDSWDARKLVQKQREIQAALEDAETDATSGWHKGNWREHINTVEDESIALVLTDPPYGVEFKSDYKLDRRADRKHKKIANDGPMQAKAEWVDCFAALLPKMAKDSHLLCFCHWSNEGDVRAAISECGFKVRGSLVWVKNNTGMGDPTTTFAPKHERIIHAVKGSPILFDRAADVLEFDRMNSDRHPTEKPVELLSRLIEATTVQGELVVDPFGGVASTAVAAKSLDREVWSCEIDDQYYESGMKRMEALVKNSVR